MRENESDDKKQTRTLTTSTLSVLRLLTISEWSKFHSWPSESGLRNIIFKKHENGFDKVVRKVGKRVLIDEDAFFRWVENKD
jgi:hypothetical protein